MTDSVVGCDFDTKKVAITFAESPTDHASFVFEFPKGLKGAKRLGQAYRIVRFNVRDQARGRLVVAAFVEQPSGFRVHPEMRAMWGVVRAALWTALADAYEMPVTVTDVPPATWKLHAIGNGSAGKPEIMAWAAGQGFDPTLGQDAADSLGIAVGGLRMLEAGARAA